MLTLDDKVFIVTVATKLVRAIYDLLFGPESPENISFFENEMKKLLEKHV